MDLFPMLVAMELGEARSKHQQQRSAHEAWAVITEELEEFKVEVFKKREARSNEAMLNELVQVAAMCQRAAEDLDLLPQGNKPEAMLNAFHADVRRLAFEGREGGAS